MRGYKLCFFIPYYEYLRGGAEYQSLIIAKELRKLEYDVFFISINDGRCGISFHDDFKIYSLKTSPGIWNKITLYKSLAHQVKGILKEELPDIVYQRILNTFSYRLSAELRKLHTAYILHIADNYSLSFDSGPKGFIKKRVFRKILKTGPWVICQTEYQRKILNEFNYHQVIILRNMHPEIRATKPSGSGKSLVWIGNARPVKQLEKFLELAKTTTDKAIHFAVIGQLPETRYGKMLMEQMNSLPNVKYLGCKSNAFINEFLLKEADFLVNTSVSEGFSNTFIQSWLTGTPVISLNADPEHFIETNGLGYFCKGSMDLLKERLHALPQGNDYKRMSENSRNFAAENFSVKQYIKGYYSLFEKVIHGVRKGYR